MIDLAADIDAGGKCLQQALVVGGREVPVDTSFRAWLRFGRVLSEERLVDPRVLRGDPVPGWQVPAVEFYADRQELPRGGSGGARAFDPDVDAGLLVASFMQAYGIDLTDPATEMHWHLFCALLRNLPGDTSLSRVMGARTWTAAGAKASPETRARDDRARWELPERRGAERDEALAAQQAWFGDVR